MIEKIDHFTQFRSNDGDFVLGGQMHEFGIPLRANEGRYYQENGLHFRHDG